MASKGVGRVSLRSRLLLMAVGAILPLAILSTLAIGVLLQNKKAQVAQSTLGLARAIATATDNELRLTVAALQALALVEEVREAEASARNLQRAYDLAKLVRGSQSDWRGVLLARLNGEVVFGTESPLGTSWSIREPESFQRLLRSGAPVVGDMTRGPRGAEGFTVRVPVRRAGEVVYVLTAIVSPDAVLNVVKRQQVPDDWVVSVLDSSNTRVARSRNTQRSFGNRPSASLEAMLGSMENRREAVGSTMTLEGERVHTALVRIPWAGWTVALGSPTALLDQAWLHSGLAIGGGLALSLLLAALAAWQVARRVARSVVRLRDDALALGKGKGVSSARTGIDEIDDVTDALVEAAASRTQHETERERLLAEAQAAKDKAEAAQMRLQVLSGASAQLSQSLEEASTLCAVASIVVPQIADICRIDLLDEDGVLQRKLTRHVDALQEDVIARFVAENRASEDTPGSLPYVMKTGQAFVRNFTPEALTQITDAAFRQFAVMTRLSAICAVPLVARGRTIGAMAVLQAQSGREFAAEDSALVGELAQRAALALDNVRMFSRSQEALKQAKVANRTKDEFMAMLGHELRNPLAPIVMSLELMRRKDGTSLLREREIIERQTKHLVRMVDDLLDVSRIASGKLKLTFEDLDLRQVVERALELCAPAFEGRPAPVVSLPAEPVHVRADPLRLTQALCNLLTNAAKFTPADRRIGIELSCGAGEVLLTVWDEGQGIEPALLPRVFELFAQGEQGIARTSGGLGLGLSIARNVVEQHGGSIAAGSGGAGLGSRFTIRLQQLKTGGRASSSNEASASGSKPRRSLRVLVVDDNADAAEGLADLLRYEGHEVRVAFNGRDALEMLETYQAAVGLLDIGLPGMSGYELARALRSHPTGAAMLLVAVTGFGEPSDRRNAAAAGFDAHLVKPVRPEDLFKVLESGR